MIGFEQHVEDYLRLRRSLGYKLEDHARLLRRFAAHLDDLGAERVTVELALAWALEPEVPAGSVVPWMRLLVFGGSRGTCRGSTPGQRSRRRGWSGFASADARRSSTAMPRSSR